MARSIEITVVCARGLNIVRTCAVGWVTTNPHMTDTRSPKTHYVTDVDTENGNDPIWSDGVMKFTVDEKNVERVVLVISIHTETSSPDKEIARGSLPLMPFFNSAGCQIRQVPLSGPTGQPNGELYIILKGDGQLTGQPTTRAQPNQTAQSNRNAIAAVNVGIKTVKVGIGLARLFTGDLGGLGDMFS